jgi:hypothetical protein
MPIWSDDYLNYLLTRGEIEFSQKVPSILTRFSLSVTAGTSVYDISANQLTNMLRVTWKGEKLDSFEHASDTLRNNWIRPQDQSNQGKPQCYLSYEYGYGKIKFHPVPNETIAADDTNIYGSDIENRVIITGYRLADPTADTYRIPEYVRRRFTKYYAMEKAYLREGPGQDLDASRYFGSKYQLALVYFKKIIHSIPKAVRIEMGPRSMRDARKVPRPQMPTTGAWGF